MVQADINLDYLKTIYHMPQADKDDLSAVIKDFVFNYFAGVFVENLYFENVKERLIWRQLSYYLPQYGKLALVRKGENNNYFLGEILPNSLNLNGKGEIVDIKVKYLNVKLDGRDWEEKNPHDYIIFYNNPQGLSSFNPNASIILKRLIKIWESLGKDIEISQGNLFIQAPFIHDEKEYEERKKKIEKSIRNGEFLIYASIDGTSPFKFHEWRQDSKEGHLWDQWTKTFSLFRRVLGMRHFTYKKKAQITSTEAEANEEQFEYIENNMWESRLSSLELAKNKWKWEYIIKEDEKEKLENELAILELQLKIQETNKLIKNNENF